MIADLEQIIGLSVKEVFATMLDLAVLSEQPGATLGQGEPHIASSVGFIGRLTGVVYLYCTNAFALRITSRLLGLADNEIEGDEMVNDAMGELGNMVVGRLKSCLSDRGMACVLTIPSIVRGNQFSIQPISSTERHVFSYQCGQHRLIVEVLIKPAQIQR